MQPAMLMSWQGSHDVGACTSSTRQCRCRRKQASEGREDWPAYLGQGPELLACWHWHVLTWCAHMVDGPQKCVMGVGCHVIGGDDWFAPACEVQGGVRAWVMGSACMGDTKTVPLGAASSEPCCSLLGFAAHGKR